jgi:hypothetical protein
MITYNSSDHRVLGDGYIVGLSKFKVAILDFFLATDSST